jgi:hypothetical protein
MIHGPKKHAAKAITKHTSGRWKMLATQSANGKMVNMKRKGKKKLNSISGKESV